MADGSVDHHLKSARTFFAAGRFEEAEGAAREAMKIEPRRAEALYLIGVCQLERGQPKPAAEWLARAVDLDGGVAEFHLSLGNALRASDEMLGAIRCYERAASLKPDLAMAWHQLGAARRAHGRIEEAIEAYQRAVALRPNFAPAFLNLGNALKDAGRWNEAVAAYGRAVELKPSSPDATGSLGNAMLEVGQLEQAVAYFNRAIKAHPGHLPSLINRATALRRLGRVDEAIASLRGAVMANPKSADAHQKLGRLLWETGNLSVGMEHYETALRLRPSSMLRFTLATLVPPVYSSAAEVGAWRTSLESSVLRLVEQQLKMDVTEHTTRPPTFVGYGGFNDREVLSQIASLHATPPNPAPLIAERSARFRVGFISAHFRDTVGLWTKGLFAELSREQFEVHAISTKSAGDPNSNFIRERADLWMELSPLLSVARRTIAELDLDVLIYPDAATDGFTYTLALSRLAPVQCAMWTHPVTTGLATMDYFISTALAEPEDGEEHYSEKLVRLNHLPLYYDRPAPAQARSREEFGLPAEAHLYGCLQSSAKFHPDFDAALLGILQADPAAVLVLPEAPYPQINKIIQDRLAGQLPGVAGRVRTVGHLPREEFGALIANCDVLLSPFPWGAGDVALQAIALGVPMVTLDGGYLRGRVAGALYRAMHLPDCVAGDVQGYVGLAVRIATDRAVRQSLSTRIARGGSALFENSAGVRDLEAFLVSAVTASRGGGAGQTRR